MGSTNVEPVCIAVICCRQDDLGELVAYETRPFLSCQFGNVQIHTVELYIQPAMLLVPQSRLFLLPCIHVTHICNALHCQSSMINNKHAIHLLIRYTTCLLFLCHCDGNRLIDLTERHTMMSILTSLYLDLVL